MAFPDDGKKFEPGESGNPNGRPKGKSFATILNALLDLEADATDMEDEEIKKFFADKNVKVTNRDIVMARLVAKAKRDADSKAMERLMSRIEGKAVQTIKQDNETPAQQINIVIDGKGIDLSK